MNNKTTKRKNNEKAIVIALPKLDYKPNSFIKSEVEKTLTLPCFLCRFSSDHKTNSLDDSVNAKYGASLECSGNISIASCKNSEYSEYGTISIFLNNSFIKNSSSVFVSPEYLNNLSSRFQISCSINSGEYSLIPAFDNFLINLNMNPLLINAWNVMLASTTSIILENQDMPCLLAIAVLTSSDNLNACFFVNLLFDRIPSAKENSTSSTNSFTTLLKAFSNSYFSPGEISTFTITSATFVSPSYYNENDYLKLSLK